MQQSLQTSINLSNENSKESCEEIYFNRWADIQFDGTLEVIDHGIEAIVYLVKLGVDEQNPEVAESVTEEIECTAYWTACKLWTILALNPTNYAHLPFDLDRTLNSAVGQYLSYLPKNVSKAINAGTELAIKCTDILPIHELSELELGYRTWVTPRLINHLIFNGYTTEESDNI